MSMGTSYRTEMAGQLRAAAGGNEVRVVWCVHRRRDLRGLICIDMRDRTGLLQLSFGPDHTPTDILERARKLGQEFVIGVAGKVAARPGSNVNPELATGEIEV